MTATTIVSERLSYTTLIGSLSNIDGDQVQTFQLPAGFGDCLLEEWQLEIASIATMVATPNLYRVWARMRVASGSVVDFAGDAPLAALSATIVGAAARKPPRDVLWREGESVELRFVEVDTNAVPTADSNCWFRVRRLRNLGP